MKEVPLKIGLSARLMHDPPKELGFRGKTLQYLEQSIAHWLMAHGALVFMVPTTQAGGIERTQVSMHDYVGVLDGLVLQGGADVSPSSYGETPLKPEWSGDRVRDLYEIDLLWECVIQQKPVLGICRGAQLINVAFGGTLWQDIRTQVPDSLGHVDSQAYDSHAHEIELVQGSGLGRLYPVQKRATVTSIHHQAVKDLGRGLAVEAHSVPDGIIEAIRWSGASYVLGCSGIRSFIPDAARACSTARRCLSEFLTSARSNRAAHVSSR
jgi:gamma-glutamyl-gamma-aminobutyrate hydrolase PuuD